MMKSENRMSKEAVKRRLNSIFGDYSEFFVKPVKPSQREVRSDDHEEPAESSRNIAEKDERIENQDLFNGGIEKQRNQASSSIDKMIEIMDIPRPLSPVHDTPKEIKQEENSQNKESPPMNPVKSFADLKTIINQISVSPLLSPIRLDIFNSDTSGSETNRKRPNDGEEIIKAKKKKTKKTEEQPSLLYSIKFGTQTFKRLLKKLEDRKMAAARLLRLVPSESALLVCDMQEKFRQHIQYFPQIVEVTRRMIEAAKLLDIKIIATEQNPKGLGPTIPELELKKYGIPVFEKTKFSMCVPDLRKEIGNGIKSVMVCGIEAHVCVFHTAIDFQEQGFQVHVVVDGCSSRSMVDRMFAYKQLERGGINLTTSECAILGLVGDSAHEKFKAVQKIIKESAPDSGLLSHNSLV